MLAKVIVISCTCQMPARMRRLRSVAMYQRISQSSRTIAYVTGICARNSRTLNASSTFSRTWSPRGALLAATCQATRTTIRPNTPASWRAPQISSLSLKKFGAARNVRTEPGEPAGSSGSGGTLNNLMTAERMWENINELRSGRFSLLQRLAHGAQFGAHRAQRRGEFLRAFYVEARCALLRRSRAGGGVSGFLLHAAHPAV